MLLALCRPALLLLLGLAAVLGVAQAGAASDPTAALRPLLVVVGFLLFSVIVNDLADEAIDRVNLPGDGRRPLVTGMGSRRELAYVAAGAAALTLATAWTIRPAALVVVAAGLAISAAYSWQLSRRGAVASLVLPALFVAVPFLVGFYEVDADLDRRDVVLVAGLYLGFVGRILLKDFRDVAGDTLYGKRTFLVRYGRRATCAFAAVGWLLGPLCLLGVRGLTPALVVVQAAFVVAALALLRALAHDGGPRRDESIISAMAIVGRGVVVCIIAHLGMVDEGWASWQTSAMTVALATLTLGQAATMLRFGPVVALRVPAAWRATSTRQRGDQADEAP